MESQANLICMVSSIYMNMLLLGNKTVNYVMAVLVNSQNNCPLVPRMTRWTIALGLRPQAIVHHGHPRHLGAIVLTIHQNTMK